jgi:xanthine/CO dehydrogenase XdhC/CoxF family maturation factor
MDAELIAALAETMERGGTPPILVTVLETKGSTPRHAGSKMLGPGSPSSVRSGGGGSRRRRSRPRKTARAAGARP